MTLGSFVHGALADMSSGDLDRMLELDESLFVEHKSDLGDETNYGLAKAISAFANTLGGWLLLGVTNGKPHGSTATWTSRGDGPTLVDSIRDRLRGEVDPLPAFEARVVDHPEGPVGVVRVYESADTPPTSRCNLGRSSFAKSPATQTSPTPVDPVPGHAANASTAPPRSAIERSSSSSQRAALPLRTALRLSSTRLAHCRSPIGNWGFRSRVQRKAFARSRQIAA